MNSFGLLKTNVLLTSNVKLIVDSTYNLFLESIESDSYLSSNKLKKYKYNYNVSFGKNLSLFYKGIPNDIIFRIKRNELSLIFDDYSYQNNNLYEYGAINISNNKDYNEKYEYFAPLYLQDKIPSNFLIFRIDGVNYDIISKENFNKEIINKLKLIKNIDLSNDRINSIFNSNFYNYYPLEINLTNTDLSYWYGIDINSGISTKKSFNLYQNLIDEKEIYELEKLITNKYSELGLIYPKIINFSFLFNDDPSTPDNKREWSINRYLGFYVDQMIKIDCVTTYNVKNIKNDVIILKNNYLLSQSSGYPFLDKWDETIPFYIEYEGILYLVRKVTSNTSIELTNVDKGDYINEEYNYSTNEYYQIICDIDLEGKQNKLNEKVVNILSSGEIYNLDNTPYTLNNSDFDVSIIEIDGSYYNLIFENNILKINSDYAFEFTDTYYRLKSGGNWTKNEVKVDFNNKPLSFNIFKVKFSDIKYFDNRIINTDVANFEYELKNEITNTQETKLYIENYNDSSIPRSLDEFNYNGETVYIPTSSEYTANLETFKIDNDKLSNIWQPNSDYCRWGYINSINTYDYPYVFNNSFILEDFNRSVDLNISIPSRIERNLDYFYTTNSNKNKYNFNSLDINKEFNIDEYINSDIDYFSNFFEGNEYYDTNKLKKYKKYSSILRSDNVITNNTLFRGIKFNFFKYSKNNELSVTNELTNYNFSILLGKKRNSSLTWNIIKEWKLNTSYEKDDKVVFNDIIYICTKNTIQILPTISKDNTELKASPYNLEDWIPFSSKSILWSPSPSVIYVVNDIVYNNGNYYLLNDENASIDFWNPYKKYSKDEIVLFKGKKYKSIIDNNIYSPDQGFSINNGNTENIGQYWIIDNNQNNSKWNEIEIWSPEKKYVKDNFIYYNNTVYKANNDIGINQPPSINNLWIKIYSLVPESNFRYEPNYLLIMNSNYYYLVSNPNKESLDNGIEIYINKKWKNILIYINNSDNTLPYISDVERDLMYDLLYNNLTAFNFINSINNWNINNGFINKLKYTIIDKNNVLTYNSDSNLELNNKYLILVDFPNKIEMNPNSISKNLYSKTPKLNIKNKLIDNKINSLEQVEWYSNIPLAYTFDKPKENIKDFPPSIIYRYAGFYEPIFINVELFNIGNTKFNINLENFGIVKEKKLIKVGKDQLILKLSNSIETTSIYPMVNEFGVITLDWDIFKSTYSNEYIYISKK